MGDLGLLELFSGIGGMISGLSRANIHPKRSLAVDLNTSANLTYSASYGAIDSTKMAGKKESSKQRKRKRKLDSDSSSKLSDGESHEVAGLDLKSLTKDWFESRNFDIWTMSPPCQPYSRQGHMKREVDKRADPLHHISSILREMRNPPRLIVLENVENFEKSGCCADLCLSLWSRGYAVLGFLLNTLDLGFPNSRSRFYMTAFLDSDHCKVLPFVPSVIQEAWDCKEISSKCVLPVFHGLPTSGSLPSLREVSSVRIGHESFDREGEVEVQHYEFDVKLELARKSVGHYLQGAKDMWKEEEGLLVGKGELEKGRALCLDIVSSESLQSMCFTRAYTRYLDGTGSVLFRASPKGSSKEGEMVTPLLYDVMQRPIFSSEGKSSLVGPSLSSLYGSLRWFSPEEASRLMGFEEGTLDLGKVGKGKAYQLLGNSLNPAAVGRVLEVCKAKDFLLS